MKPVVFIPEPIAANGLELLSAECECLMPWGNAATTPADLQSESFRAALFESDAVIVRLFQIKSQDIQKVQRLKVIGKHGVGVDNIDCQAATAAGIPVVFTPTANANAVAEHTLALMFALVRQISPASQALMQGRFHERGKFKGVELAGKTLGVIGLGRIGQKVAQMASQGLQMDVLAYDPFVPKDTLSNLVIIEDSLESLMRKADFLTLHIPLAEDTRHLINEHSLGWVKPSCRIINTSRGSVIDEAALAQALSKGTLAGAALDVFEVEPLPADHLLLNTPNTLLTPHISSSTQESLENMSLQAAQGVLDVLHGNTPKYIVNPESLRQT
jgi:D-3-phosphoglycerate dehydrogenase